MYATGAAAAAAAAGVVQGQGQGQQGLVGSAVGRKASAVIEGYIQQQQPHAGQAQGHAGGQQGYAHQQQQHQQPHYPHAWHHTMQSAPIHQHAGPSPYPPSHHPHQHPQQQHHQHQQQQQPIDYGGGVTDDQHVQLMFSNVARGLEGAHRATLTAYWQDTIRDMETREHDFKQHALPLARIKKVMKSDEEVKMISAEAPILFAKGCEIFITELTMRAWIHAEENKRRTLQRSDIANAISRSDMFDFLIDIVPREDFLEKQRAHDGDASKGQGQQHANDQRVQGAAGGFFGMSTGRPAVSSPMAQHQQHPQQVAPQQQPLPSLGHHNVGQLWPRPEPPRHLAARQGSLDKSGMQLDPHAVNHGHHDIQPQQQMAYNPQQQQQQQQHILAQQHQQPHGHPQQHLYGPPPPHPQQQQPHYAYSGYGGYYPADMASIAAATGHYFPPIMQGYDHQGVPITVPQPNYGGMMQQQPGTAPPPPQQQQQQQQPDQAVQDGRRASGYDAPPPGYRPEYMPQQQQQQQQQQARYGYEQQGAMHAHQMQTLPTPTVSSQPAPQHMQQSQPQPQQQSGASSEAVPTTSAGEEPTEEPVNGKAKKPKAKRAPRGKKALAAAAAAAAAVAATTTSETMGTEPSSEAP